jgi:hypothetical protein
MEPIPFILWKEPLQIFLNLFHRLPYAQPPPNRKPVNMGVYRKGGDPKRLRHDY